MSTTIDLYEVLGVKHDAPQDEIKAAYRKLVLEHHPDRGGKPEFFEIIADAYNTLKNADSRKEYDEMFQVSKQSESDFFSLRKSAKDYFNEDGMTEEEKKAAKRKAQAEFQHGWMEMNSKHGFNPTDKNSKEIDEGDANKRLNDLMQLREQENIEYKPDQLFEDPKNINMAQFNAAFDALYKKDGEGGDMVERKNPSAWGSSGEYASLNGVGDLYVEGASSNLGLDGQETMGLFDKSAPIKKVTKADLSEVGTADYYTQHNFVDKNFDDEIKKRLAERELDTAKFDNRDMGDFSTDPDMAGYNIFKDAGVTAREHIDWEPDDDMRKKYTEFLEFKELKKELEEEKRKKKEARRLKKESEKKRKKKVKRRTRDE